MNAALLAAESAQKVQDGGYFISVRWVIFIFVLSYPAYAVGSSIMCNDSDKRPEEVSIYKWRTGFIRRLCKDSKDSWVFEAIGTLLAYIVGAAFIAFAALVCFCLGYLAGEAVTSIRGIRW